MDDENSVVKLTGALEKLATAHKGLNEQVERIKAEISPQVKELPAVKEKIAEVEKAITEKSATLETQVKELQGVVGKCEKVLAFLGGEGGGDAPVLRRIDPGYFNPNQKRYMPNATAAKAMALFVHAVCTRNAESIKRLDGLGIKFDTVENVEKAGAISDDEAGGYLLPPEFGGVIITAMSQYGIAPQYCDLETMGSDKKTFATDGNDVDVYAMEEGGDIEEVEDTYGQRTLEAKTWGAFARWSLDYEEYGLVNMGETWAARFARAIAKKMDMCVFKADGTKTYNNLVGLFNDANVVLSSLGAGKTSFNDVAYDDILALIESIPDEIYEEGNCRFFGSASMLHVLRGVKDGIGRPIFADPMTGMIKILGEDYVRSAVFPRIGDDGAGTKFIGFGDLRRAMKLGIRTRMVLMFSAHAFFTKGQNALRVVSRFGNKSSEADGFGLLKTADA